MPVITTSGLAASSSILPVFGAALALEAPGRIDAYTAFGASMATFLMYTYLRTRAPGLGNFWSQGFTCLSALFGGWLLPEPLFWWMGNVGWIQPDIIGTMPMKVWGCAAMACGLSTPTLVLIVIYWAQQRLPGLFRVTTEEVATVQLPDHTTVSITHRTPTPPDAAAAHTPPQKP